MDHANLIAGCQALSQVYAIESQTFVLHATTVIGSKGIEAMSTQGGALMSTPGGGCSAIFGPDGRLLTELLEPTEEGIVYAELDFDAAIFAKSFLDVAGHYSRPDLLWLGSDTREKKMVMDHESFHKVEKIAERGSKPDKKEVMKTGTS
jgi:nitrilase